MAAPSVVRIYPADNDTGIPVGQTLEVYFDRGVDEQSVKESIVLFASESDTTSGPDNAIWIDEQTGDNKFFLSSPGFKGYVPLKFEFGYWDTTDLVTYAEISAPSTLTSEADEVAASYGHKVKVTIDPKFAATLAPDTLYTFYVNGDPDTTDTGVSSRTVFDLEADGGNTGSGSVGLYGTYTGNFDETVRVKITKAGNIGTAEYKWWYDSAGEGSAVTNRITNRRYRTLENGLQIRFTGSSFVVDDLWGINVETVSRLATSTSITFTTNDGSYTEAPESPSTPASSSPPTTVLPSNADAFEVQMMVPENASYNINRHNRTIVITFTGDVDPSTVTDDSVTLLRYPVEGHYDSTFQPVELAKSLSISGDTLTITF
jgi:hypothetical protein